MNIASIKRAARARRLDIARCRIAVARSVARFNSDALLARGMAGRDARSAHVRGVRGVRARRAARARAGCFGRAAEQHGAHEKRRRMTI